MNRVLVSWCNKIVFFFVILIFHSLLVILYANLSSSSLELTSYIINIILYQNKAFRPTFSFMKVASSTKTTKTFCVHKTNCTENFFVYNSILKFISYQNTGVCSKFNWDIYRIIYQKYNFLLMFKIVRYMNNIQHTSRHIYVDDVCWHNTYVDFSLMWQFIFQVN